MNSTIFNLSMQEGTFYYFMKEAIDKLNYNFSTALGNPNAAYTNKYCSIHGTYKGIDFVCRISNARLDSQIYSLANVRFTLTITYGDKVIYKKEYKVKMSVEEVKLASNILDETFKILRKVKTSSTENELMKEYDKDPLTKKNKEKVKEYNKELEELTKDTYGDNVKLEEEYQKISKIKKCIEEAEELLS